MTRTLHPCWLPCALAAGLLALASCRTTTPPPTPARVTWRQDLQPTFLDYVDSDAFDGLFESALVTEDPVIVVRTGHPKPDWDGRLNAWIAAWNMGGKVAGRTARGQSPLPKIVVDGDSIREFRLLVTGLMDRVEWLALNTSTWWAEDRVRARRVTLLRPYNLRFHMAEDGNILLIFFHGNHAHSYADFMRSMMGNEGGEPGVWERTFECSLCSRGRQREAAENKPTRRAAGP